ncbi:MAG: homoserine dehydrogenase [Candidatus Omnitrophica bacterium]|nr:homoserine dehydrogenase [Candidatus Omnitrophota bacterium]
MRVGIGLLGLGTVGMGVFRILKTHAADIARKTGVRLELKKICVKSLSKKRSVKVPRSLLTDDARKLLSDPSIQIVVELIGGIHPAKEIIGKAFQSGKHVVTANKALLAEQGSEIFRQARRFGKNLGMEASVCGGIPLVKSLKEGLASNRISHFLGIVNGTCNFILTSMSEEGMNFKEALKEAQARGYAEKDPRLDVEGTDSAHKLAVLARLSFGAEVSFKDIFVEGIGSLSSVDIAYAKELGYGMKLLAIGKKLGGGLELRVHPTMLPFNHPLSSVRGVYNAVFVHADQAGDLLFYGKGAGMFPAASAVMSDVVDIAKQIVRGARESNGREEKPRKARVLSMDELRSEYYLHFQVIDKPGVLGRIAQTLGKNRISILSVHQKESHDSKSVPVVILTHQALEKNVRRALRAIDAQKDVTAKPVLIRVEK